MLRIVLILGLLFASSSSLAAGWYRPSVEGAPSSSDQRATDVSPTNPLAYFIFTSSDSTTTTGPVLDSAKCERIEVTLFLDGATGAVALYESSAARGTTGVAVTNLPQITSDFDADGVADSDSLDQSSIEKSGLRNFMADGIVPIITSQCSTGTCLLKVQCGGTK